LQVAPKKRRAHATGAALASKTEHGGPRMTMHSSRRMKIAPPLRLRPRTRTRPRRHHATEPWRPRATDLCADRVAALATCVALHGPLVLPDGERVDAHAVESLAREQRAREIYLQETFGKVRVVYEDYHRATHRVREILLQGIEQLEGRIAKTDAIARTALRTAKLRRPPKATVARLEAITAKRRNNDPG
jgi:hypothetical protein